MTYAQVADEAKRLTPVEKLALAEQLLRDLREVVEVPEREPATGGSALTVEEKLRIVDELSGSLKPLTGVMPTDGALREAYTDDLIRKYLGVQP